MTPDDERPPRGCLLAGRDRSRVADRPGRLGEGRARAARPASRRPRSSPRSTTRARGRRRSRTDRCTPRSSTASRRAHRIYPKLLPLMNRAFESFDLSGFDLILSSNHSCAKNVFAPPGRAARLLLPHADAARLGAAVPGGRDSARSRRPCSSRCSRGCGARTWRRPRGRTTSSRTHSTSRTGSRSTTGARRGSSTRRSTSSRCSRAARRRRRLLPLPRARDPLQAARPRRRGVQAARPPADRGRRRPRDRPAAQARRPGHRVQGRGHRRRGARAARGRPRPALPGRGGLRHRARSRRRRPGTPVVAYGVGGARESVIDGETGVLFDEQSEAALADAIERLRGTRFDEARSATTRGASAPPASAPSCPTCCTSSAP